MTAQASDMRVPESTPRDDELTLFDLALMVWRRRWVIVVLCAVSTTLTFAVSKLMPKVYESTATLVAPREGSGSNVLGGLAASSLIQQVPGLAITSLPSFTPNRDLLVGVLKSRTIAQGVVDRFGLQARYRTRYVDDAIRALRDATTIAISREVIPQSLPPWRTITSSSWISSPHNTERARPGASGPS